MKIVLTAHQFLPHHSSGTEIIVYTTARELRRRGHDVRIVAGFPVKGEGETIPVIPDDLRFDTYEFDGFPVDRFKHAHIPMGGQSNVIEGEYYNRLFLKFFRTYLKKHQPDIVHFIHLGRLTTSAIDACVERGVPTVFSATDFWFVCPTNQLRLPNGDLCNGPRCNAANCVKHMVHMSQPPRVQKILRPMPLWFLGGMVWAMNRGLFGQKWYARYVRALAARAPFLRNQARKLGCILAPSHFMQQTLIANGLPAEKMEYLPYGIDISRITRHEGKGQSPTLRVVFTGTLFEHKGVDVLVKAVRSLPESVPVELKLHGKLDDFPAFVEKLRGLIAGDRRITLCGPYDNTQLDAILAAADVLVCASIWYENTPLVVYEAHAAGVPVIGTDLAGIAEVVKHEVNGLLFKRGDHQDLARAIRRLAEDRPLVARLAAATIPPMTIPDHVAELEKIYARVAATPTGLIASQAATQ